MDIEKRLTNLENLVHSFIKSQSRTDDYKTADIKGCRHTDLEQQTSIDANTSDISEVLILISSELLASVCLQPAISAVL